MKNPFKYSDTNKRYFTYDYYNRQTFGKRMYKLAIQLDVTCPNRDGNKGVGGCLFCSERGSGNGVIDMSVKAQIQNEKAILSRKGRKGGYLAYFQSFTNTYGNIDYLRKSYFEALDNVVDGIIIATRSDALSDEVLALLNELNHKTYLIVELGLQSANQKTLDMLNRCETIEEFEEGYFKLKELNIKTGIHIIDSLPNETYDDMMNTARLVSKLHPNFLKIHALHIIKDTPLCKVYETKPFDLLTRSEYIKIVCDQLEILPSDIVIERLTGDGQRGEVVAPIWTTDKLKNLNGIDKEMSSRDSYQGKFYKSEE